jgi:hypothetical protein
MSVYEEFAKSLFGKYVQNLQLYADLNILLSVNPMGSMSQWAVPDFLFMKEFEEPLKECKYIDFEGIRDVWVNQLLDEDVEWNSYPLVERCIREYIEKHSNLRTKKYRTIDDPWEVSKIEL